jgi:hypothetical protein
LALTVQYVGNRPYVEFNDDGVAYGFSRGMIRDDIPAYLAERFSTPNFPQWKVEGLKSSDEAKAASMKAVVEPTEPAEESPVVLPEPEPEPEADSFDVSMTRAKMMAWCKERGIEVSKADTKASLTEKAQAHLSEA